MDIECLASKDWRLPQPNFSGHTVERNWVTVLPNDTETEPFAFFLRNGQRWRLIFDTRTVSSETRGAAGIGTLPTPSEEDLDVEGPPRDGTTHVCVCGTRTSTEQCCSNMSASNVRVHRLNIPSTSVTLHVSRVSALPTLWPMLSFWACLWRGTCRVSTRHDLCVTNVSVPCGEKKTVSHQPCDNILRTLLHTYQSHDTYKDGSGPECCPLWKRASFTEIHDKRRWRTIFTCSWMG